MSRSLIVNLTFMPPFYDDAKLMDCSLLKASDYCINSIKEAAKLHGFERFKSILIPYPTLTTPDMAFFQWNVDALIQRIIKEEWDETNSNDVSTCIVTNFHGLMASMIGHVLRNPISNALSGSKSYQLAHNLAYYDAATELKEFKSRALEATPILDTILDKYGSFFLRQRDMVNIFVGPDLLPGLLMRDIDEYVTAWSNHIFSNRVFETDLLLGSLALTKYPSTFARVLKECASHASPIHEISGIDYKDTYLADMCMLQTHIAISTHNVTYRRDPNGVLGFTYEFNGLTAEEIDDAIEDAFTLSLRQHNFIDNLQKESGKNDQV